MNDTDPRTRNPAALPLYKKILFLSIPFLIFLAGAEGVLRFTVGLKQIRFKCHYPILDNQYCKNIVAFQPKTGNKIISNSDGLLDKEYPLERIPGSFRIAVLGDSFTAGEETPWGKTFHELWEEELPGRLGFPVEILNFGVGGIGLWKELQTYHLRAHPYKPDLTVLAFYWGNDFDNTIEKLKTGQYNPLKDEYPVTSLRVRLEIIRRNFNQWLWNHVALYQFTHTRYHMLEHWFKTTFPPEHRKGPQEFQKQTATTRLLLPPGVAAKLKRVSTQGDSVPAPSRWPQTDTPSVFDDPFFFNSETWTLIKDLFLKLKQEVEADGGKLMVIHFMSEQQYIDQPPYPVKEFDRFLQSNGIHYVDPNPYFGSLSREELARQYIPEDIHFGVEGNATLARLSIDTLESLIREHLPKAPNMSGVKATPRIKTGTGAKP